MASDFAITRHLPFPRALPARGCRARGAVRRTIGAAIAVFLLWPRSTTCYRAPSCVGATSATSPRHQPFPMAGVLVQRHAHGAAHRVLQRHHRHHRRARHRGSERRHDPVRLAAGADEPAGADLDHDVAVLVRLRRRRRAVDRDLGERLGAADGARLRLRHLRRRCVFFFSFGLNQWLQYRGIGRGAATPSARRPTSCSAWAPSRCSPGRSTAARWPAHPRQELSPRGSVRRRAAVWCRSRSSSASSSTGPSTATPGATSLIGSGRTGPGAGPSRPARRPS